MTPQPAANNDQEQTLRIVHVFRSPVGGIFRHVRDLVDAQESAGHHVGIICDNNTGGTFENDLFSQLKARLTLGLHRFPMQRSLGLGDITSARTVLKYLQAMNPDVVHAHGAKGGAYGRLANAQMVRQGSKSVCLYTPHGGSMHYDAKSVKGRAFFFLERVMQRWTDRLLFVSTYEQEAYFEKVGMPSCPHSLVHNGINEAEFEPVNLVANPADFLFIGMMRDLKGVDLFINALEKLPELTGSKISAHLVGDGPDLERYKEMAKKADPRVKMEFHAPMPVREAFELARCVVVPSRAESLPYLVLETLAAQKPLIATNVGGIPEVYGKYVDALVKPDEIEALADAMHKWLTDPATLPSSNAMAQRVGQDFSVSKMSANILDAYRRSLSQQ